MDFGPRVFDGTDFLLRKSRVSFAVSFDIPFCLKYLKHYDVVFQGTFTAVSSTVSTIWQSCKQCRGLKNTLFEWYCYRSFCNVEASFESVCDGGSCGDVCC